MVRRSGQILSHFRVKLPYYLRSSSQITSETSAADHGQTTVAESRNTSPITTHMLDISNGRPAVGVPVSLHRLYAGSKSSWEELSCRVTDKNGRIHDFLPSSESLRAGDYRLVFNVSDYVASTKCLQLSSEPFFPEVTVRFRVDEAPQKEERPAIRFDNARSMLSPPSPPSPLSDISQDEDDPVCIRRGEEEEEGGEGSSGEQSPTSRLFERAAKEAQGAQATPEKRRFNFLYDIARNPKLAVAARAEMCQSPPRSIQGIQGEFFEHAVDVDRSRGIISKVDKSAAEESLINQEMGKVIIIRLQSSKLAAERLLSILQAWKAAEDSYAHTMKGLMDLSFASEADGPSLRGAISAFYRVPSALELRHASTADVLSATIPHVKSVVNELRHACEEIGHAAEVAQRRVDASRRTLRNALTVHQTACRNFDAALKERMEKRRPRALDTIVDPWMTEYKLVDAQEDLQSAQMQQRRYLAGAFRRVGELELRRGDATCQVLESLVDSNDSLMHPGTRELEKALNVVNLTSDLDSFSAVAEKSVYNGDVLSDRQAEWVEHMWREVLSSAEIVRQGDLFCCCYAAQTWLHQALPQSNSQKGGWVDGYGVLTRAGYLYWFPTAALHSHAEINSRTTTTSKNSAQNLGQPIVTLRLSRCHFEMGEAPMWKLTDRSGGNAKGGLMGSWLIKSETVMLQAQDIESAMDWTACLREVISIVAS